MKTNFDPQAIALAHIEQARDPDTQIIAVLPPYRQLLPLVDRQRRPRQHGREPITVEIELANEAQATKLRAAFKALLEG